MSEIDDEAGESPPIETYPLVPARHKASGRETLVPKGRPDFDLSEYDLIESSSTLTPPPAPPKPKGDVVIDDE